MIKKQKTNTRITSCIWFSCFNRYSHGSSLRARVRGIVLTFTVISAHASLSHVVKTTAKLSSNKTDSPTSETNLDTAQQRIIVDASNITHSLRVKAMILERMKNGEELIFVDAVIEFGKNDTIMDKVLKIYDKQNPEAFYVSERFIMSS